MFNAALALDVLSLDTDALLAADPAFHAACDARHEGYLAHAFDYQHDPDAGHAHCVRCGRAIPCDEGEALTHAQADRLGVDADTDLVCFGCLMAIREEEDEAGACRACHSTGNGADPALPCRACSGRGHRLDRTAAH